MLKYLGYLLSYDVNNAPAIRANLKKAHKYWVRISWVLRAKNATPQVTGMFYNATVQAVLLFGLETWNLKETALKKLEGFHIKAAWRMVRENKPCRGQDGVWRYPTSELVLKECRLHTMPQYIKVRRNTVVQAIARRPVFNFYRDSRRRPGTSPYQ